MSHSWLKMGLGRQLIKMKSLKVEDGAEYDYKWKLEKTDSCRSAALTSLTTCIPRVSNSLSVFGGPHDLLISASSTLFWVSSENLELSLKQVLERYKGFSLFVCLSPFLPKYKMKLSTNIWLRIWSIQVSQEPCSQPLIIEWLISLGPKCIWI